MNRANKTGNMAEKVVSEMLDDIGYQETSAQEFFAMIQVIDQPLYTREAYISETIYGGRRRCDFLVYHPNKYSNCLVIEAKWQASSGSIDEKYPYLVLNIQQGGYDTVIVLGGGGYSDGARSWLVAQAGDNRSQIKDKENHLLAVLDIGEFQRWAKRNL